MSTCTQGISFKNYRIYRVPEKVDEYDPCAGIEFAPKRGSDELFDVLKAAYPHGKTHRTRVREAVIEFLVKEHLLEDPRTAAQFRSRFLEPHQPLSLQQEVDDPTESVVVLEEHSSSPTLLSWLSGKTNCVAAFDSSFGPRISDSTDKPLPSGAKDPKIHRPKSPSASITQDTLYEDQIPGEMVSVFSISGRKSEKKHHRRPMTEVEIKQYRRARKFGACDLCRTQKRKVR